MKVKELMKMLSQLNPEDELLVIRTERVSGIATEDIDLERLTQGCGEANQIGWVIVPKEEVKVTH